MRETIEFWFDLPVTFLQAIVAVLVSLFDAREHTVTLWGLMLKFCNTTQSIMV